MQQETFIIGEKEYTCMPMNAFVANKLLIRIQKIVVPVLGILAGGVKGKSLMDIDVKVAAQALSEHLDETVFDAIVLPMFNESKLYSVADKRFIKDAVSIDIVFKTETLFDLYELVWLVGRFQFAPFFASIATRFGSLLSDANKTQASPEPLLMSFNKPPGYGAQS